MMSMDMIGRTAMSTNARELIETSDISTLRHHIEWKVCTRGTRIKLELP